MDTESNEGNVEHEDTKSTEGESHNGTGSESCVEAVFPSGLLGTDGCPDIGVDSYLHS